MREFLLGRDINPRDNDVFRDTYVCSNEYLDIDHRRRNADRTTR